jgi:hypothetical protein
MLTKIWVALVKAVGALSALWAVIPVETREMAIKTVADLFKDYFANKFDEHKAAQKEKK